MPWTSADAQRHTKKASSGTAQRQWADVANATLAKTGDEGRAVKAANSVVRRRGIGAVGSPLRRIGR